MEFEIPNGEKVLHFENLDISCMQFKNLHYICYQITDTRNGRI